MCTSIKSKLCTFKISYNFICQLYLNKAEKIEKEDAIDIYLSIVLFAITWVHCIFLNTWIKRISQTVYETVVQCSVCVHEHLCVFNFLKEESSSFTKH